MKAILKKLAMRSRGKSARRWWQRLLRAAVGACVLLAAAYVMLPWWLPGTWVRRYLAGQMSRQMGVEVRIAKVSLSWADGIEIRGLEIDSPQGFDTRTMAYVPVLRFELSPVNFLFRKRVAWMEMDRPRLAAEIDAQGNVNVRVMERMHFDAEPDRFSIRRAAATFRLPHHDQLLLLKVTDMQFVAGRLQTLGRITMSAQLHQRPAPAPVALRLDATAAGKSVAATASFNFAHVDLAQLNLVRLLGLPLRKLSGRCGGSLDLQINRDGRVDRVRCNLTVRQLDLQPLDPDLRLPVIREAGFRVSASFDLAGGRIDLQSLNIRLPGIDLTGRATLFPEALMEGNWQAIQRLELQGEIYPTRLAALLTGRAAGPGRLEVRGPIRTGIQLDHDGYAVRLSGHADATGASIRRADGVLKPSGEKLRMELDGILDERSWQFAVNRWNLALGGNMSTGSGRLGDVRKFLVPVEDSVGALTAARDALRDVQWNGRIEIRELDSLRRLAGPAGAAFEGLQLHQPVTGELLVDNRQGTELRVQLNVPVKADPPRAAETLRLFAGAMVPADGLALEEVELGLVAGRGRVLIDRGQVRLITHLAASRRIAEVELTGDFEAVGVGDLLARLPHLGVSPRRVRGSLAGRCLLRLSTDVQRVHVSGDLTDLEVRLGEIFVKPLGRRLKTTVDFLSDRRMPSWQRNFLRWRWLDPQADLRTEVAFGPGPDGPQARWSCRAEVKDARWLLDTLPQLPKALAGGRLSGAANLLAEGTWRPGRLWADLCCDADALEYVSGDSHRRSKRPGVPLRIRLAGQLARRAAAPVAVEVDALALDLGGSHVRLAGRAQVALDAEGRPPAADLSHPRGWAAAGLRQFEAKLTGLIAFDPALAALFPEVGDLGRRHGLDGSAEVDANIRADENEATLWGHIDADRLAFRLAEGVSKPVGLPARAALAARAPADLSRFHVSNLQLRAGDVHLLAGGSLQLRSPTDRGWDVDLVDLHLAAWTRRADTLVRLAEGLGPYRLKGDAIIEAEWTNHHGGYLRYVSVGAESLRGYYRGKTAVVSGRLLLGDLRRNTQGRWKVGRLRTDGLELQAGKNHLWLIADLSQLADSLTGDVHLLAEYIDQRDLIRWLAKPKGDAVEARAAEMVGRYKATLCRSRLRGTVKINHLRTWNAGVSHYYDVRNILVDASLDRGAVTVAYTNGLNGGTVRGSIEVELAEESPIVALRRELKDLAAKENIQPQLALFFPGNTVYGFFNRRSDMRVPLVNLLANAIDFRVPLRPVGTAKTVTIDGMTQGRAAPTFVTRLFPGLNLAKYRYRKMTSFSEFLADGSVSNDMIFDGHTYDLYIMGDTDAQNIGRYTVGLILIGNPQPAEWNHTWRLGRLPIFNLKARIEGGQLHDVEVVYPWPNESLGEIFLRNNILYRAFLASRKK